MAGLKTCPLSSLQWGMLFAHTAYGRNSGINILQNVVEHSGGIDPGLWKAAWEAVAARHEVLRGCVRWEGLPAPELQIEDPVAVDFTALDWSGLPGEEQEREWSGLLLADRSAGFELREAPLFRVTLIRLGEDRFRTVFTVHHIVADGCSLTLFVADALRQLRAIRAGRQADAQDAPQFGSFAAALCNYGEEDVAWFRARLEDLKQATPVPFDGLPVPTAPAASPGVFEWRLAPELAARIAETGRRLGITLNTFLQAAWGLLLQRYTGEKDVLFGATKTFRRSAQPATGRVAGPMLMTVPVRLRTSGETTCADLLQAVRRYWIELRPHERAPLTAIRQTCPIPGSSRLFETLVLTQPMTFTNALKRELGEEWCGESHALVEKMEVALAVVGFDDGSGCVQIEYDPLRFAPDIVRRIAGHLETAIELLIDRPEEPAGSLSILSRREIGELLGEWNATRTGWGPEQCVHDAVAAQAAGDPDRIAVVGPARTITYGELNSRANQLARFLRKRGIGLNSVAGVEVERSEQLPVCLLAVLKSGAAYLPLDPLYPAERRSYMTEQAGAALLLNDAFLAEHQEGISAEPSADLPPAATCRDLAYVLYTSGSTGKPKGVEIEHGALINFLRSFQREPGMRRDDVLLAITTVSFDIAGLELFLPLITGARVVIATRDQSLDGRELQNLIDLHRVTVLQATPATWRLMIESGWKGSRGLVALCGGEALSRDLAAALAPRCAELWNLYGPTETTIWSLIERIREAAAPILIGRPIANTEAYVVGQNGMPLPAGLTGELWIGGAGVARGYRAQPSLTAERFVRPEFQTVFGGVLYRTGDLARFHSDGRVECLGRVDHQVKIRGFRVELGEIEFALKGYPAVRDCAVVARQDQPNEKRLVGYVVESSRGAFDEASARKLLAETLPPYMVPAHFVVLDKLPLTLNLKVDRKALPPPAEACSRSMARGAQPRNDIEERLCLLWARNLRRQTAGAEDDYFETGGDSLGAMSLLLEIERSFAVRLAASDLMRAPTPRALAPLIAGAGKDARPVQVVHLDGRGDAAPIFWIPGTDMFGTVTFRTMSALLAEGRAVYVLLPSAAAGSSLREMVQSCADIVRGIGRNGPCHLFGYGIGSWLAYEVAARLSERGEHAGATVLFDCPVPGTPSGALRALALLRNLAGHGWQCLRRSGRDRSYYFRQTIGELLGDIRKRRRDERTPEEHLNEFSLAEKRFRRLARDCAAAPRPAVLSRLDVILASLSPWSAAGARLDSRRGWSRFASQTHYHVVEGSRFSMMEQPRAEALAAVLRDIVVGIEASQHQIAAAQMHS